MFLDLSLYPFYYISFSVGAVSRSFGSMPFFDFEPTWSYVACLTCGCMSCLSISYHYLFPYFHSLGRSCKCHVHFIRCFLLKTPGSLALPEPHQLAIFSSPIPYVIYQRFRHALILGLAIRRATTVTQTSRGVLPGCILGAHARQNIVTRTQTNKESKWNQPHTQAEIRSHLGERGDVFVVDLIWLAPVILSSLGRGWRFREMAEP